MRAIPLLLTAAALTGCATQPPPATQMAESQAKLQELTAGKVAGPAISCLPPSARSRNLEVIDDRTFAYVDSSSRVYVNHVRGECSNLWSGFYTLVVSSSGSGTFSGDIAYVAYVRIVITSVSCALCVFVLYIRR